MPKVLTVLLLILLTALSAQECGMSVPLSVFNHDGLDGNCPDSNTSHVVEVRGFGIDLAHMGIGGNGMPDSNATYQLALENSRTTGPTVFDPPFEDYNCTAMVDNINVSAAIMTTQIKFALEAGRSWVQSGLESMDSYHAWLTQMVQVFSANADVQLASWSGDEKAKRAPKGAPRGTPRDGNISEGMADYFDRLFHDRTYLTSDENSYVIIRVGVETNKELGPSFLNSVKFAISLPKTQKHLQIFVGDPLAQQDQKTVNDQGQVNQDTAVGVRYFVPDSVAKYLKTSLSGGFRGITNPYAQLRFEYPVNFYDWLIRPIQYFDYSIKRAFYEQTELIFDRRISKKEMVRLQFQRSTEEKLPGMAYGASLSYFSTLRHGTGFRTFVSLAGQTVLNESPDTVYRYDDVHMGPGVSIYSVGASWKASFLRKWLFYEIDSRVDFQMLYNWRPNYVNQFWLEVYFGDT
jgi:hypothetical protein